MRETGFAATYPGDKVEAIGQLMGPNLLGEYFRVFDAEHDQSANTTRLVFKILPPDEVKALAQAGVIR